MLPDRSGPRRAPVPLLPGATWVVLASLRLGKVAVLLVLVLVVVLVEWTRFASGPADVVADARRPVLVAVGATGVALGVEIGFAFGGGRGLVLVGALAWLVARLASLVALTAYAASVGARRPLFSWRRCLVVGAPLALVLLVVLLGSSEVTDPERSAVAVHGVRLDLPGGVGLLLLLVALSLVGEGVLQWQAQQATVTWMTRRPAVRRSGAGAAAAAPPRPSVADEPPIGPALPSWADEDDR